MFEVIDNPKGFKVIKMHLLDLMEVITGALGICDSCNNGSLSGYYIPVLNSWYCEECYQGWIKRAIFYKEDVIFETKNYENMIALLKAKGISEIK